MPVNTGADAYKEKLVKYNGGFLALHEYQSVQEELTWVSETRKFEELQTILKAARMKIISAQHISNPQLEYEKQFKEVTTEKVQLLEQQCKIMENGGSMIERKFVDEAWKNLKMAISKYGLKMKIVYASNKERLSHEEKICRESIEDLLMTMAKVDESDFARNKKRHFIDAKEDRDWAGKERLLATKKKYLTRTVRNLEEKEKEFEAKEKRYLAAKEARDLAAKERYVNVVAKRKSHSAKERHLLAEERFRAAKQERDLAAEERDSAAKEKDLAVKEKNLAANERTFAAKKEKYFANERILAAKQGKELTAVKKELAVKKKELAVKKKEVEARTKYLAEKERNFAEKEEAFLLVKEERGLAVQTNTDFAAKKRGVGDIIKFLVARERDIAEKERELAAKERDFAAQEARNLEAQILVIDDKIKMELEIKRVSITIRDKIAKHMQVQQDYEAKVKDLPDYSRKRNKLQKEIDHAFSELRQEMSLLKAALRHICSGVLMKIDVTEETVDADDSCPICMNELSAEKVVFKVSCNHLFHARCITEWMKVKRNCPYCRQKLVVMKNTDESRKKEP